MGTANVRAVQQPLPGGDVPVQRASTQLVKIFIGGIKPHHQQRFARAYPQVTFEFAAFEDPVRVWLRGVKHSEHVIIDQSRCSHKMVMYLQCRNDIAIYFTDSKAFMRTIIEEILAHGKAEYIYK